MKFEYTMTLQNNKEISLIAKCGIFTALRILFNKFILRRPTMSCNSLHLEEDNNILSVESNITYDIKNNNKFTNKCAQMYISPNFTPYVTVDITWHGYVLTYSSTIQELYRQLDQAARNLEEYGYAYIRVPNEANDPTILKLLTCGEPVHLTAKNIRTTDDYTEYYIKYDDAYMPELYY